MSQETMSSLVQIMVCQLFGAKPLPEAMLTYYWLVLTQQIWVICEWKYYHIHSSKCIWKCCLQSVGHFFSPQCVYIVEGHICIMYCPCIYQATCTLFFWDFMLRLCSRSRYPRHKSIITSHTVNCAMHLLMLIIFFYSCGHLKILVPIVPVPMKQH